MKKNDNFTIEITGMSDEGHGVGRIDGIVVFIPSTLPGEVVSILIVKVLKNYAFGKILEIITPSPDRIDSECEYFNKCGGCQLWHTTYESELTHKHQKVKDCLTRIGGIHTEILPVIGAENIFNYRNKAQFPVSMAGIGVYAVNSHRLVNVEKCIIQNDKTVDIVHTIREWMKEYNIAAYDEIAHNGIIRHIYTRTGANEMLVCIVTKTNKLPHANELTARLLKLPHNIVGIVQNINSQQTNVVLGNTNNTLYGRDFIYDNIGTLKLKVSLNSFYQVNNSQTKLMYDYIKDILNLNGSEIIWDLYCGIGTIGLYLAKNAGNVIGVEAVKTAGENAGENAKINNITNAEFHHGLAEELIPRLVSQSETADIVIVDPPRKGCDIKLLDAIAKSKPNKIVYVSCKPSTLARDLKVLEDSGYITTLVQPIDMFPRTSHVETVILLSKLKSTNSIEVKIDLDEMDLTTAESKATYDEIKQYVLDKFGLKVSQLYIAQVKRKHGIIERDNYNVGDGKSRVPQVPADKEKAIEDALRHFQMI